MKQIYEKPTLGKPICGKHSKIVVIVSAAATLLCSSPLAAIASTASTDIQVKQMMTAKAPHGLCSVIAQVDGDLSPLQQAQLAGLGADVTCHLGFIHSVALTMPTHNLRKLAALPFVSHLSYDGAVKKCDAFTDGNTGADTAYTNYGLDGTGINIAVVDSGIGTGIGGPRVGGGPTSPDLNRQIVDAVSFVPTDGYANDWCGHGTHVSGIIAGNGNSSKRNCFRTFYGVARNAGLVNVRVLDQNGQATVSTVLAGIQWVVANKDGDNIRVMNLSLGHSVGESYKTDPLCQAVEAAWKAGIVVICAAGNNGRASLVQSSGTFNEGWGTNYGSINSPGNDPYVITVGATKRSINPGGYSNGNGINAYDKIATYSGRGPSRLDLILKPDIIAPGNRIISVVAKNSLLFYYDGGTNQIPLSAYASKGALGDPSSAYFQLSGTSMAAPVVAGAAALLLQANPSLTPDTIKARLMVSADKWLDPNGDADPLTYGAGYLNIPAALASIVTVSQPALSPALILNSAGTINIDTSVIASKALSGVTTIWGSKALSGVNTVYGSKALSGVSTIYSSSIWADKTICGTALNAAVDLSSVVQNGE